MNKSLSLTDSITLLRGDFIPFADANLSVASSPVLYGLCVYSVFGANWNDALQKLYVFRLRDHYERLLRSCRILGMNSIAEKYPFERFAELMHELLQKNEVREDALVRVMVFIDEISAGTKIDGLSVEMTAYVYPMGEILNREGIHVCVSSWTRNADNMIPPRAKVNGSYVNASLMKNEAILNGYDEAIALDVHGHVAEGTVANLFIVRGGKLVTPHAQTDILEGITRNSVIKLAESLNIPIEEREIDRTELYIADEAMFVGSSANVTPILSIDKRIISEKIGPITQQLKHAYRKLQVGENETFSEWVSEVAI